MIALLLLGCTEPSTLESVAAALADQAAFDAEDPLRLTTAIAGVVAETCGLSAIDEYTFVGRSAEAIGALTPTIVRDDDSQTWTFEGAGLDGEAGTLVLVTDDNQQNFAVTYSAEGLLLTAGIELRDCDDAAASAVVGGTGTWTTADASIALTLTGAAPANGVGFAPTTADVPTSGQLRASSEADGWVVLLDDAATLTDAAGGWTGKASGTGWTYTILVGWP